jgi:hypothetical protein
MSSQEKESKEAGDERKVAGLPGRFFVVFGVF